MKIRPITIQDANAVITLWQACGLVVSHNDPRKDIERKLKVNPELFLVGEVDGEIIASVMGGYEGHRGWLNYLAVSPNHRRKGYGQQIVAAVEKLIATKGSPKINLQVRSTNAEVIEFYRSLGYGEDKVLSMGKRLVQD
ncbi:GNAT family acetyltransferase [Desulfosediminicola flagellatus]|uniref:GNAT family acetyltransferase n=1 Tax=Desulfosediminicola flagellatus TaxID=2569541 RepID=UPI0010AB5DCC|nr:GNAT family acetyltransferase [Desulfosediminicola flagellatus]